MKIKLIELDLSEKLVDEILSIFDIYTQSVKQYSKPKGKIAFQDNLNDIKSLSKKLQKRLGKLSRFELQLLNQYTYPDISQLKLSLIRLQISCQEAKKKKIRFSKKRPFLLSLAKDLCDLLESNGIPVNLYRDNLFCQILNILLDEPEDSEKSFNLLRQILQ